MITSNYPLFGIIFNLDCRGIVQKPGNEAGFVCNWDVRLFLSDVQRTFEEGKFCLADSWN